MKMWQMSDKHNRVKEKQLIYYLVVSLLHVNKTTCYMPQLKL